MASSDGRSTWRYIGPGVAMRTEFDTQRQLQRQRERDVAEAALAAGENHDARRVLGAAVVRDPPIGEQRYDVTLPAAVPIDSDREDRVEQMLGELLDNHDLEDDVLAHAFGGGNRH